MTTSFESTMTASYRRDALCLCTAAVVFTASASSRTEPTPTGVVSEQVQTTNLDYFAEAPPATSAEHDPERATGTVLAPWRQDGAQRRNPDGTEVRFTCGATFVSPRYAITAGHCVNADSVVDAARNLVTVQMYRFPAGYDWEGASTLSGAYPVLTHPPIAGYASDVQRFSCRVVVRCYGGDSVSCPIPTDGTDIAPLRCDTDVTTRGFTWLDVYTLHPGSAYGNNLHYWGARADGADTNQIVQLASRPWPSGELPRKLGLDLAGIVTDLGG